MAPYHAPPTKVLSSTPLSSSQAHAFLSTFTLAANDRGAGQNEIVLTNLRRIEQALLGVYVPRPTKEDMVLEEGMTDMAAPIVEEEGVGEEYMGGEENGEDEMHALEDREEERSTMIPEVAVARKPKVDKKADKKARRKEEKKARAEQRKREKQDEDDEDDDEE